MFPLTLPLVAVAGKGGQRRGARTQSSIFAVYFLAALVLPLVAYAGKGDRGGQDWHGLQSLLLTFVTLVSLVLPPFAVRAGKGDRSLQRYVSSAMSSTVGLHVFVWLHLGPPRGSGILSNLAHSSVKAAYLA